MRRRISLLLATMLAGTTLVLFGPAQPASAIVVCGGAVGAVGVAPGLLYPVLLGIAGATGKDHVVDILVFNQTNIVHAFTVAFAVGGCVHPPSTTVSAITGAGILKGYCGHSSGTGTINGAPFSYVSLGGLLVLTGHVVGMSGVVPTPGTGSCFHIETPMPTPLSLPSGAVAFTLLGAVAVGLNCLNALPPSSTLVTTPFISTLIPSDDGPIGLHIGPHVTHIWTTGPCVPQPLDHL